MTKRPRYYVPVCVGCWLDVQTKTPLDNRETRVKVELQPCVVCDSLKVFMFDVEVLEGGAVH